MLSQTRLAARLGWLFGLKQDWVQSNLLPLFMWDRCPQATALWEGYLWQFEMPPDLWPLLKEDFLETVRRFAGLKSEENAASWFTGICIRQPEWISHPEAAQVLQVITPVGRAAAARVLWRFMEAAGASADEIWRERIGPWLQNAWPLDRGLRDAATSRDLALAAIETRQEFTAASAVVLDLVAPSSGLGMVTWQLKQRNSSIPETHPLELLGFLNALLDVDSQDRDINLGEILQRIARACQDCTGNPEYTRLHEYVLCH